MPAWAVGLAHRPTLSSPSEPVDCREPLDRRIGILAAVLARHVRVGCRSGSGGVRLAVGLVAFHAPARADQTCPISGATPPKDRDGHDYGCACFCRHSAFFTYLRARFAKVGQQLSGFASESPSGISGIRSLKSKG